MARPTATCCELRSYPDGIKDYGREHMTTHMGRRGKHVKKLRLIHSENAFALARKFQGRFCTTPIER